MSSQMSKHALAVESSNIYSKQGEQEAVKFVSQQLPNYTLNTKLSDDNSTVLNDAKDKNVIIAYRGTLLDRPKDLKDDLLVSLGVPKVIETQRLHEAQLKYERVKQLYPNEKITTSGHSLGGVESYYVSTKNNIDGHHYNIGSGLGDKYINLIQDRYHNGKESYERQNIYHADRYKSLGNVYVGEDPLSSDSKYMTGKHHVVKVNTSTTLGAHDLTHFYRLNENELLKNELESHPIKSEKSYILEPELFTLKSDKLKYKHKKMYHKYN